MTSYPTNVFIEILMDLQQRISFVRNESYNGISCSIFNGVNGNMVMIDTTDETIDYDEGVKYLGQLGLFDLISALYPSNN